jgi:hypothetical protein
MTPKEERFIQWTKIVFGVIAMFMVTAIIVLLYAIYVKI